MFQWVVVRGEHRDLLERAIAAAVRGGSVEVAYFAYTVGKKGGKPCAFALVGGAATARAPRWPEVLADWRDIYDEPLAPGDAGPAVAEEVSGLGADAVYLWGEPGLGRATAAWYAKGALSELEHVGGATVRWTPAEGLGRPPEGGLVNAVASAVDERIELQNKATGETILRRALLRMFDVDPPTPDELAGLLTRAPKKVVRVG